MVKASEIVDEAKSWLDVPYRHLGRSRVSGIDCVGLITEVAAAKGYKLTTPHTYSDHPSGDLLLREANGQLAPVGTGPEAFKLLQDGMVMMFWTFSKNEPQHFAWFYRDGDRPMMIHAFAKEWKVCNHGMDHFWKHRLVSVYDLPGVER